MPRTYPDLALSALHHSRCIEFIVMALNQPMPVTVKPSALSGHYSRSISAYGAESRRVHSGRTMCTMCHAIYVHTRTHSWAAQLSKSAHIKAPYCVLDCISCAVGPRNRCQLNPNPNSNPIPIQKPNPNPNPNPKNPSRCDPIAAESSLA